MSKPPQSGDEGEGEGAVERPAKKKRKRRTRKQKAGGRRPPFARGYPPGEDIDTLLEAMRVGNHALVRRRTAELLEQSDDEATKTAARDLRRRLSPDPTSIYLWALGVALAIVLYGYYLVQSHG